MIADLLSYYTNLLIAQYSGLTRAKGLVSTFVQPAILPMTPQTTITFSAAPTSGTFVLSYNGHASAAINYNDSASTIQTKLQAVSGLSQVTVSGSIASQSLIVTMTGITLPALSFVLGSNSLSNGSAVSVTIGTPTDNTVPLAVRDAFNLSTASGTQLDILGKYAGVTRSGYGLNGNVTLSDADFLTLIQFAIIVNSAGSSLSDIQSALLQFFPNEVLVFDYSTMRLSYMVNSSIGSQNLIAMVINLGLLPKPMGVALSTVVYNSVLTTFFGCRTYVLGPYINSPMNSYSSYNQSYPWVSYETVIGQEVTLEAESGNDLTQENSGFIYI